MIIDELLDWSLRLLLFHYEKVFEFELNVLLEYMTTGGGGALIDYSC